MPQEPERLDDDDLYELDRKAWNLPRRRPKLTIVPQPEASADDGAADGSASSGDPEPGA